MTCIPKKLTLGSLFSGIGGFELGLERTGGFEVKFQVENDPYCQRVLAKHWPDVQRYGDIRAVTDVERVDVLCGGFPCQDISNAGDGAGIDGERSGLWSEYVRCIRLVRPRYIIVENVAALLGRGMGRVIGDLAACGYDAQWDCLPAEAFGAPHERDRIFIVAYPQEERRGEAREFRHRKQEERISSGGSRRSETNQIADDRKERTQRIFEGPLPRVSAFSWCQDVGRIEDLFGRSDIPEPVFRGTSDGIPNWAHRVGACGNAIVPQIAEWIGNRILEFEMTPAATVESK